MKTKPIQVSEKAHAFLVARAAYLTLEIGKKVSLKDTLDVELGIKILPFKKGGVQ